MIKNNDLVTNLEFISRLMKKGEFIYAYEKINDLIKRIENDT
jgi:hypothetical protein